MTWHTSRRRQQLPADWDRRRRRILERDRYRCTLGLDGCTGAATEVHHLGSPDDHSDRNLAAACSHCHAVETSHESQRARGVGAARRRPKPKHPGLA